MSYPFAASTSTTHRNRQISTLLGTTDDPSSGTFRACQALLSLERICAAFSTSSLGSTGSTEEEIAAHGPQSWFTDSNSASSSSGDLAGSDPSSSGCERFPRAERNVSAASSTRSSEDTFHSVRDEFAEERGGSIGIPSSQIGQEDGRTAPQSLVRAPPIKTVKWASPLSPVERHYSVDSTATSSSSSSSSHNVRSLRYGKGRPRSSSSSSPSKRPSAGKKFQLRSVTSDLAKATTILKPMPALGLVIPTSVQTTSPIKSKSKLRPVTPPQYISSVPRGTRATKPPVLPPRSPLRPSTYPGPSCDRLSVRHFESCDSSRSTPVARTSSMSNDDPGRSLALASNGAPGMQVRSRILPYDYTSPVQPLKVIKKNSARSLMMNAAPPPLKIPRRMSPPQSVIPNAPTTNLKPQKDAGAKQGEDHSFASPTSPSSTYSSRLSLASLFCGFASSSSSSGSALSSFYD